MKELLFKNWSVVRIIRTVIGLFLIVNGIVESDYVFLGLGTFIFVQGLFQVGCASGNCDIKKDE